MCKSILLLSLNVLWYEYIYIYIIYSIYIYIIYISYALEVHHHFRNGGILLDDDKPLLEKWKAIGNSPTWKKSVVVHWGSFIYLYIYISAKPPAKHPFRLFRAYLYRLMMTMCFLAWYGNLGGEIFKLQGCRSALDTLVASENTLWVGGSYSCWN